MTAILLIPIIPGRDFRFDTQDTYAQVVREVAEKFSELMADTAHPNAAGHIMFARILADFLINAD